MKNIFSTIQTIFALILTAVNLVELLATGGTAMTSDEKRSKARDQLKALFKQSTGLEFPAWLPDAVLNVAIDLAVTGFNKTGWFTSGTVNSSKVMPGGVEHATPAQ